MTWPTHLSASDPLRALSDVELRRRHKRRSTAVHNIRLAWGSRKQDLQVKDQTVLDSESESGPDSVIWATVPNRNGKYIHLVKTRRTQVEVVETRSPNGQPLSLTCSSGRYHVWKPNGAILRILRIWNLVEWLDPPSKSEPEPDIVVRKMDPKELPASSNALLQRAAQAAGRDLLPREELQEFHAVLHPVSKGLYAEISRPGHNTFSLRPLDPRTAIDLFKNWLREGSDHNPAEVFDLMPRSAIIQGVLELARNRWAPTPDIVHAATHQKIAWSDARYADFSQRISSDRQEAKGWWHQLEERGIKLQECHLRIPGPGGKLVRIKHYRYDA